MTLDQKHFQHGLNSNDISKLLQKHGPNQFANKKSYSTIKILISQFTSPLVYVLAFAGLMTIYLREWFDASVILLVVLINSLLGFYQEKKAAKALEALKVFLKPKTQVIRDGQHRTIPLSEIVPGDICVISPGQSIPADGVLVLAENLTLSEAMLTGESRAVNKKQLVDFGDKKFEELSIVDPQNKSAKNWVYMGTIVKSGVGHLLVVKTGRHTQIGKIAQTLATLEEKPTPLQRKLVNLSKMLSLIVVISTIIVFLFGWWRGEEFITMLETAIAIAVSAIPESLVISLTVILSLGMQRIFKRKALVRKLLAAETLGSVSVICCDKTGTLTEGKLTVAQFVGDKKELIKAAILANDEVDEIGSSLHDWAQEELKKGSKWTTAKTIAEFKDQYQRLSSLPFSSERKYMASLVSRGASNYLYMVGAPELIISKSSLSKSQQQLELSHLKSMTEQGYRVIGVASKKMTDHSSTKLESVTNLTWQGLLAFEDQVRPGVKEALSTAHKAGINIKVITGDYAQTAVAVLEKLGFAKQDLVSDKIMTGEQLTKYSKSELRSKIKNTVLFSRTTPDQKLEIVKVLQELGEVVAMTGDGVNDAPALKAAEIGVVVNEASDVSKETADMVLLNSNFKSIVLAVKEGRIIIETMKKVITCLLTDVFSELILIGGSLMMGWPLPITAVQILWVNLVEDSLPGLSLAFETSDDQVMEDAPKGKEKSIIDSEMVTIIVIVSLVDILMLVLYGWLRNIGTPMIEIRTIIFVYH